MPALERQLKAAQEQATTAQQGLIDAKGKTATQAAEVATLKADLTEARQQAATATKVPELERQLKAAQEQATTAQQEAINTKLTADKRYKELRGQALEIQAQRNEFAEEIATLKARAAAPQPVQQAPTPPAAQAVQVVKTSPTPEKSPRESFLEAHKGIDVVTTEHHIDGARLDAAEGRLGVFSWPNRVTGGRNQVLCEVPSHKAMTEVGQCFDIRAAPGRGKWGIG